MRAQRAKLKSRRDDTIIAPGKRSAARGYGRKMIPLFSFGFGAPEARQTRRKKEIGWGGVSPRAAVSAALPGAILILPLRGLGPANQRATLDAAAAACLHSEDPLRCASEKV